jgi:hypothetical protein
MRERMMEKEGNVVGAHNATVAFLSFAKCAIGDGSGY